MVLTRGIVIHGNEFPFFLEAQMARDMEASLNLLFVTRSQRSAREILKDGDDCRACGKAIVDYAPTCKACNGAHRRHEKDKTCRLGRCQGQTRAEVSEMMDSPGESKFPHALKEMMLQFEGDFLDPTREDEKH